MSTEYDAGTRAVAYVLGAVATSVLAFSGHLAHAIDRPETPAGLIVVLALASVAASGLAVAVPGASRLVCLALATLPLLWVVAVLAATA